MSLDTLKPLNEVLVGDDRWRYFGVSLADHHAVIAGIELNESVPQNVRQHFENARNTWLYAFFAYRLLSVALLAIHMTCEAALKERAKQEGLSGRKSATLQNLLDQAIARRWIVDTGFSVTADQGRLWEEHRVMLRAIDAPDCGPYVEPTDDQAHARRLADAIRFLRNDLAHGETMLVQSLAPVFQAVAEFINQLFPPP